MSTKNNANLLEARLTVAEAMIKMLQEELSEIKSNGSSSVPSGGEQKEQKKKQKGERKKADPDAPKRERSDKQKAQDEWRDKIKSFMTDDDKKHLKDAGFKGNVIFTLGAYLKEAGSEEITAEVVSGAVKYLVENPDYKSKAQKERSEKEAVSESDSEKAVVPAPPGEKSEKSEKKRVRTKKEKTEMPPSSDKSDEEEAVEWEFAGEKLYLLKKTNAVIDTDFEYVGIFDGKKIDRKAEAPASVKEYLAKFE